MDDQFDRLVYVLSSLKQIRAHVPASAANMEAQEKKHMSFLDHIALILVTKAQGDVAATMMEHTSRQLTIYYAKNAPCSDDFRAYLARLQIIIAHTSDHATMQRSLIKEILFACRAKFNTRVKKCQQELKKIENLVLSKEQKAGVPEITKLYSPWAGEKPEEIVGTFLSKVRAYDRALPFSPEHVEKALELSKQACMIGMQDYLKRHPTISARVRKLGAYFGAAWKIRSLLQNPDFAKLRENIQLREVRPPPPRTIQVPRNLTEILNTDAKKKGYEAIGFEDLKGRFPDSKIFEEGVLPVTVSVHCELTLAEYFFQKTSSSSRTVEIGVSKRLCWLCQRYVENLNRIHKLRVLVSENQGKIHAGWAMPQGGSEAVKVAMLELIDMETHEIRESIIARRRSDFFPGDAQDDFTPAWEAFDE